MRKDDKIQKLDFSDEFLLESASRRLDAGDHFGALTMLNKRNGMYEKNCDAAVLAADIYESMELYALAVDAWFHFLDTCNEADFPEGYEGLAVNYMNMGNEAQSAFYYNKLITTDEEMSAESKLEIMRMFAKPAKPRLRVVYPPEERDDAEDVQRGVFFLKTGQLSEAKNAFSDIEKGSPNYATARGLSAVCSLLQGNSRLAEEECLQLLEEHPDDVQALSTYSAVLSEQGREKESRRVAARLAQIETDSTDELYKIATVLCENDMDEDAYRVLSRLKEKLPYDNNILYFYAVAAYRTGKEEEAIDTLDRLCTIYPHAAVARYYLTRMREARDGERKAETTYYYRVPQAEYETVKNFLSAVSAASPEEAAQVSGLPDMEEFLWIAFDEMDGRDAKLQELALKVADQCRLDAFLRDILLDFQGNDGMKLELLERLAARNEENSFGTVLGHIYKEFFTHKIAIGNRKYKAFMKAFSLAYARYGLLGEENERKLCSAAEETYRELADREAWDYMDETAELACVIYREAHLRDGERTLSAMAELFDAKEPIVKDILDQIL